MRPQNGVQEGSIGTGLCKRVTRQLGFKIPQFKDTARTSIKQSKFSSLWGQQVHTNAPTRHNKDSVLSVSGPINQFAIAAGAPLGDHRKRVKIFLAEITENHCLPQLAQCVFASMA